MMYIIIVRKLDAIVIKIKALFVLPVVQVRVKVRYLNKVVGALNMFTY